MTVALTKKDLIAIRPAVPEDKNFILATFLQGVYYSGQSSKCSGCGEKSIIQYFRQIDKNLFSEEYGKVIRRLFLRPALSLKIACLKQDPDVTLGYCLFEGTTLHYLFTKPHWRGIGIARDLLPEKIEAFTHMTPAWKAIAKKKYPDAKYNPFLIEDL